MLKTTTIIFFLGFWMFLNVEQVHAKYKLATTPELNQLCDASINNTGECAQKIEKHQLSKMAENLNRSGSKLEIKIASGQKVVLIDKTRTNSMYYHYYLEYLPEIKYHLVFIQYYEGTSHILISNTDGKTYSIHDIPHISPNKKTIIVTSASEAYNINGVFIWRIDEKGLVQEYWYEPKRYALYYFNKWIDNNTVELNCYCKLICQQSKQVYSEIKVLLKRSENKWKLNPVFPAELKNCN